MSYPLMNNLLQVVLILLNLAVIPLVIGGLLPSFRQAAGSPGLKIISGWIGGFVLMWAIFQLLAVPMIWLHTSFHLLLRIWCAACAVLLAAAIVRLIRRPEERITALLRNARHSGKADEAPASGATAPSGSHRAWYKPVLAAVTIGLILFQMGWYAFGIHLDEDDSRFVVQAVEAVQHDRMTERNPATGEVIDPSGTEIIKEYTSPWPMYVAAVSVICVTHPTIMAHMILPVFLVALGYAVWWLLGDLLTRRHRTGTILFVLGIALLNLLGHQSVYTQGTFFLTRLWQGKAVVAGVMLPLLICVLLRKKRDYFLLLAILMSMCLMSGMGIIMSIFFTVIAGALGSLISKRGRQVIPTLAACIPSCVYFVLYQFVLK